ncbi:MAG TPA: glycosyltransferase [Phycisphaerae bacterium]|nr:glycosyltransferase [Phycisphaerae bacterium]
MRVFMLGWEFPPSVSGGLGVACYGLAKALNGTGVDVLFVLPKPLTKNGHSRVLGAGAVQELKEVAPVTSVEVQAAVEHAAEHPVEGVPEVSHAVPQGVVHAASMVTRVEHVKVQEAGEHEVAVEVEGTEREVMHRVTFVPVDAWLEPYMTPGTYQKMVVEELVREKPVRRWEKRMERHGEQWVERAVSSPASEPPPQPPVVHHHHHRRYLEEATPAPHIMGQANTNYAGDLFQETERYARLALAIAKAETFDVIHAHDWMTFEAAMAVAAETGKPLVVQIHSTELDRAGHQANARILEVEREGMLAASKIVAVSYKTKTQLIEKYGIDPQKIEVVYNAADAANGVEANGEKPKNAGKKHKTVLFLGRMVAQKGPDYFLRAAKKILAVEPDVKFVMAGKGEMVEELKRLAEELEIHRRVIFTGFLKKSEAQKAFRAADVYVMPSVSEPFGIAPLEALAHDVPVILSKQSGVAEVLQHVLKVDFWDTEEMADKILAVLRHPPLAATLREFGQEEVRQLSWDDSARRIVELYEHLTGQKLARMEEERTEA